MARFTDGQRVRILQAGGPVEGRIVTANVRVCGAVMALVACPAQGWVRLMDHGSLEPLTEGETA